MILYRKLMFSFHRKVITNHRQIHGEQKSPVNQKGKTLLYWFTQHVDQF